MKGKTPNKSEKAHMDAVRELGCIVCNNEYGARTPAAIHHTRGKTQPGAHMDVLPLCANHHQHGQQSGMFISIHPWKARFEAAYGTEAELLEQVRQELEQ